MDRMIYTAMTGASASMHRQQVLANNLANASTPGFRAELSTFRAVPARGDAYFAVQGLDGTEAYTRAGALEVNTDGTLVNAQGLPMLSDGGPLVVPPNATLGIGEDGSVTARGATRPPGGRGRLSRAPPAAAPRPQGGEAGLSGGPRATALPAD